MEVRQGGLSPKALIDPTFFWAKVGFEPTTCGTGMSIYISVYWHPPNRTCGFHRIRLSIKGEAHLLFCSFHAPLWGPALVADFFCNCQEKVKPGASRVNDMVEVASERVRGIFF